MSERKEGYYWVEYELLNDLQIAEWLGGVWTLSGNEMPFNDSNFTYISKHPITKLK